MLKSREEFVAYRNAAKAAYDGQEKKVIICAGTGCVASGSLGIYDRM